MLVMTMVTGIRNAAITPPAEKSAHKAGSFDFAMLHPLVVILVMIRGLTPLGSPGGPSRYQQQDNHGDHQPGDVVGAGDQHRAYLLVSPPDHEGLGREVEPGDRVVQHKRQADELEDRAAGAEEHVLV